MTLWVAAASCALAMAGCSAATDSPESTGSTQSAVTTCVNGVCTTTYVGVLKSVNLETGEVTIQTNGTTVTLTHTALTVHIGVVPGPMHGHGVVPGPMHGLEQAWNNEIARGATQFAFLVLLERFAWGSTPATLTTTDNSTIASVQPQP